MASCKNMVILLAGGSGNRFEHKLPKQFVKVFGKTILEHTLDNITSIDVIDEIYLVCHADYIKKASELVAKYQKIKKILPGGKTRAESIEKGLNAISNSCDETKVLIHDSIRPLISQSVIEKIFKLLDLHEMVQTVISSSDDVVIKNQFCHRDKVKCCSGPEGGRLGVLKKAYHLSPCNSVLEACSKVTSKITTVESNPENVKITHSTDIIELKKKLKKPLI